MSLYVMVAVLDAEGLTPNEKIVAISYADHAHHDGTEARAGLDRISKKSALSRRTVNAVVKSLLEKKVMEVQRPATNKLPVCYRFLLTEDEKSLLHWRPAELAPQGVVGPANDARWGADPASRGADSCTQTNEPSEEPSSSPKGEEYSEKFELLWSHYPRKIGKAAAYRAARTQLRKTEVTYDLLFRATINFELVMAGKELDFIMYPSKFWGRDDWWKGYLNDSPSSIMTSGFRTAQEDPVAEAARRNAESAPPPKNFAANVRETLLKGHTDE